MKSYDQIYRGWKIKAVSKLFEFIKQGAGKRHLQLAGMQNGKFEAILIESGSVIAKHESINGDAALVGLAISVMNIMAARENGGPMGIQQGPVA